MDRGGEPMTLTVLIFLPVIAAVAMTILPRELAKYAALGASLAVFYLASQACWDYKKNPDLPTVEKVFTERLAQLKAANPVDQAEVKELEAALKVEQVKHLKHVERYPWMPQFHIN